MFILRLRRSSCSIHIAENMPPCKKQKTSEADCEKQNVIVSSTEPDSKKDSLADWRARCKSVCDVNSYALKKGVLTDVTFVVGEESFHAHRLILALGSPVFEAMFYGALAEKGESITIPDVDPDGFRNLLKFLYSDEVSFPNDDVTAFKTYFAADKYCVTRLKEFCENFLINFVLKPANVWIFLESSLYLNSQAIKDRCFTFLKYNVVAALQHKNFLDVSVKTIETFLGLDSLDITEMNLLLNVIRWAENKSNTEQENSFQSVLMPLLRYIRFGALTAPQFINFLETKNLNEFLKDQDALAILKHIIQPLSCALPDWCCTKTSRNSSSERAGSCDNPKIVQKEKKQSKSRSKSRIIPASPASITSSTTASSSSYSSSSPSSSSSSSSSSSDSDECDSDSDYLLDI